MKKMMMTLAAVATFLLPLFVSSCSDNDDEEKAPTHNAVITINPRPLYETLQFEDALGLFFANRRVTLLDSVLIYNQAGQLVKKLGTEPSYNFQSKALEVEGLADGTYTFIVWQTLHYQYQNMDIMSWVVTGEEQLSTVSIMAKDNPVYYLMALGYDSATLTVRGSSVEASFTPKAAGSIIDFTFDNVTAEYGYDKIILYTRPDQYNLGVRLDPALGENERYIQNTDSTDYNCVGYSSSAAGHFPYFTLSNGNDLEIFFCGEGEEYDDILTTSQHVQLGVGEVATCYFDQKNWGWQPPFFGTAEAFGEWKSAHDAGILVADPLLDWGCNYADVEQHIQAKQWWKNGNDKLELWSGLAYPWHRWYYVAPKVTEQYLFETEDGKNLGIVLCYNRDENLSYDAAKNWLLQLGFIYDGITQSTIDQSLLDRFITADRKSKALLMATDNGGWYVTFSPLTE